MAKKRKQPPTPKTVDPPDVDSAGRPRGPKPDRQLTETERRIRRGNPWDRNRDTETDLTAAVDAIVTVLTDLRPDIPDLLRIQEHDAADPYAASTRPSETPGGASDYTPTERAALRGWPGDNEKDDRPDAARSGPPPDPARHVIEAIWNHLHAMDRGAAGIAARKHGIYLTAEKHAGHVNRNSDCEACKRDVSGAENDRLRSGYCEACYRQWLREGRPDRVSYEMRRLEQTRQAS